MVFWIVPLALAGFVLFWCAVVGLIAQTGWARLANTYATPLEATGETFRAVSGRIGLASYNNVLTVSLEPEGLRLAVMILFRPGHPPLLIPWSDITNARKSDMLWGSVYAFEAEHVPTVTIRLPERIIASIIDLAD